VNVAERQIESGRSGVRRYVLLVVVLLTVLVAAAAIAWRSGLERLVSGPPAQFERRAHLAACGTVDCLRSAMRDGGGAELVVTAMTTEGDPITSYYRAVPGQPGLEIYLDSTRDRFRAADWSYLRCPDARGVDDLGHCTEREL
jgi:hypothetical protein